MTGVDFASLLSTQKEADGRARKPASRAYQHRGRMMFVSAICSELRTTEEQESKVKTAGFRPGNRHTFDWPLKSMQKPAELLLNLDPPTLSQFPMCVTDSACLPLARQIVQLIISDVIR